MRFLQQILAGIIALFMIPIFFWGLWWADVTFFPVLDVRAVDEARINMTVLRLALKGTKLRPCQLVSYGFGWRIGAQTVAVGIRGEDNKPTTLPNVLEAGDDFYLGPYLVPIPSAALSDN